MRRNLALAKLRAGQVTCGPSVSYASPDLAEQVAHLGFDWVWLDAQHGCWSRAALYDAVARFLPTATAPIVRVESHDPGGINHVLDMGAMGVIVPMVQNAEEARAAVRAAYYPPLGRRSVGGVRPALLAEAGMDDYVARANEEVMLVVMVESEEAVADVTAIMDVPGVDVVLIGPADLMLDVRAQGHDAAHHERLVEQVAAASRQTGVAAGYVCTGVEAAQQRITQGFRFLCHGSDHRILMAGLSDLRDRSHGW
jgi:4-hydroxy-2-oxoheptanedioate aldolase